MIDNGVWSFFSLIYYCNQDKTWDIILNKFIFTMDYVKVYSKGIKLGFKADKYMVRNLTRLVA